MNRPFRVLLVEDNPGDVDLIRESLEYGGRNLQITVLDDGAEALAYLLRRRRGQHDETDAPFPDLMLLDLNLPKVSGHDVLGQIRQSDGLRALPIVVITSSDATRDIVMSYKLGANCYLTKPGDLATFQAAMKAVGDFWLGVVKLP
jgi:CheY-like chemotaxis protein